VGGFQIKPKEAMSEEQKPRLCKDCKWITSDYRWMEHVCGNPKVSGVSLVDGSIEFTPCRFGRAQGGACQEYGYHWEEKPAALQVIPVDEPMLPKKRIEPVKLNWLKWILGFE
jgi:hypothetical protein